MRAGTLTRRELLKAAACGTAALAIEGTNVFAQAPRRPPNILFIMADDLGYADVSCYGRPDFTTPNVDHLAATGVRFLQAYANSAVCSATRTGLMTGRYQYRLRVGLEEPVTVNPVGLPPEHPTIPSLLRKLGYSTSLVGKWHLGQLPTFGPLVSGYDHFYGFRGGAVDYYSHGSGGHDDLWDDDVPVQQVGYMTDLLGNRAAEVIDRLAIAGRPFFVSLHFNAPHWPWEAPGDEANRSESAPTICTTSTAARSGRISGWSRQWTSRWAESSRRWNGAGCGITPSSSSPATTAASGSPRRGRSPGGSRSCSRAASGSPP